MKKTLAMLLALVMLFALAACGSKDNGDSGDALESSQPNGPAVYTYEEDRSDFKVTWELTMYPNGIFYLNETHGLSGEVTEHSGNTWRENDNGTISTGPWSDPDVDKSDFFQPNGECTWIIHDDGTMEPTDHVAAGPSAGSYAYSEDRGDFSVEWTVILNEDGTFALEEVHGLSGNLTTHTGKEWTDNGDGTFTTGAWDADENKSEFFKPNGECTWRLLENGQCEPVTEGGASSESTGIAAGKYTYIESKGPGDFQWDILLMGNGNCRIDETNPGGEVTEHIASGWTDNGDGTVTTGEWEDSDVNKSDFFKPNGEAVWKINADGTCEPVAEGEGGGAASAINPGKYTYVDGDTTWEVKVMGNGTCVVSEMSTATGDVIKEHTTKGSADGAGWVDNGDGTFETDEWEPEEREDNKVSLASPNGVTTWKVVDAANSLIEPTEKKEAAASVEYGRYLYHDESRDEYWAVMIMGNGDCTIQKVTADGELIKIDGELLDYPSKGFRVNDDGTFTTFAMEDESNAPEFLSEGGMATWKVVDAANKVVEMVVE